MDSTKTTKITPSQKRPKPNDSDSENDNDNEYDNGTWPRYLIIEPVHEGELVKLSPFAVSKGINGIAGEPKSLKRLRSGAYLVEVTRKSHADNLLRSKLLATVPIKVSPHRSLNSKKGVIWCRELDTVSLTEIKQELASQQVTEVKRISDTCWQKGEHAHIHPDFWHARSPDQNQDRLSECANKSVHSKPTAMLPLPMVWTSPRQMQVS